MRTALIVEDTDDIRFLMKMSVESQGWQVMEAVNGAEAIAIAVEHCRAIHLILMDLNLPVLNGFEATKQILALDQTCHIPVVAVSAHCWEFDWKEKAKSVGCLECLEKPVDFKTLHRVLAQY